MNQKAAFRSSQNRLGMSLVVVVLVMLLVVVSVNVHTLKVKQREYAAREAELDEQIAKEQNRTTELEEFRKYTQTQAYIEEVAKSRLGLVREGEIVFKMK